MQVAREYSYARVEAATFIAVIIGVAAGLALISTVTSIQSLGEGNSQVASQNLRAFQSYSQLEAYISANARSAQAYNRYGMGMFGGPPLALGQVSATFAAADTANPSSITASYTGTNVQVQGVDEPDRVKTDGQHLFVSNGTSVTIINAYPPNSTSVLSRVDLSGSSVQGLEIAQDRLMVIAATGYYYPVVRYAPQVVGSQPVGVSSSAPAVELLLYDTSSLTSPRLIQNVTIPGNYVAARLADGYVYAVIQQPSYTFNSGNATAVMPTAIYNGAEAELAPSSVYYTASSAQISYYTMIPSMNMASGTGTVTSVLTGPSATVYVSTSNIYIAYTNYLDLYDVDGIPGNAWTGGVITSLDVQQAQNSTILKASYSNGNVVAAAAGVVPGTVLNQFSLDEYNGYFRVATNRFAMVGGTATTSDDVYVLNPNLTQVSALRNIAPGENIYAVRFVGETGYVVTFEQIDPLFVISFKDVAHPVILSALKVSGYSDYLHPLPNGYLIGVGKDAFPASNNLNYSFYLGLKLSLFRVFDNGSSVEVSRYLIGDRGTDSPVLNDHLAFTYDSSKNVMVIPVLLAVVPNGTGSTEVPAWGNPVWQGVYVFRVNETGFTLLGRVSQYPAGQNYGDSPDYNLQVDRSVIIGNYLYTFSQAEVMISDLSTFSTLATVTL